MENEKGVWRTVRGRRIFIRDGESLGSAMARSGKFSKVEKNEAKRKASFDDRADKLLKEKPFSRKQVKEQQKYSSKYNVRDINSYNQNSKNRPNENAPLNKEGKTRVERNYPRYSQEQQREVRHENLQKKLQDYKAKKQSNNKIETEANGIKLLKIRDNEKGTYIEDLTNKYNELAREGRGKADTYKSIKKEIADLRKQSNNKTIHTQSGDYTSKELKQRDNEIKQLYKDTWEGKKSYKELNDTLEDLKKNNKVSQGELDSLKYDASMETNKKSNNYTNDDYKKQEEIVHNAKEERDRLETYLNNLGDDYGEDSPDFDETKWALKDAEDNYRHEKAKLDKMYEKKNKADDTIKSFKEKKQSNRLKKEDDWLPKETEIKEQGTSNRKEVSDNIQAHILEYYGPDFTGEDIPATEAFVRQMDAMSWLPTNWKRGEEIAKGGSYLIYNGDMAEFLDKLKINPKGKKFSEDKSFEMYTSLIGRESAKLYDKIKKHQKGK